MYFQEDCWGLGFVCANIDNITLVDFREEGRIEKQNRIRKGGRMEVDAFFTKELDHL